MSEPLLNLPGYLESIGGNKPDEVTQGVTPTGADDPRSEDVERNDAGLGPTSNPAQPDDGSPPQEV